jgi:hypothetical protein
MEWFSSERLYDNTEKYLNGTEFRAGSLSPCSFRSAVGYIFEDGSGNRGRA